MRREVACEFRLSREAFKKDVKINGVIDAGPDDSVFATQLLLSVLTGRELTETVELTEGAQWLRARAEEEAKRQMVKLAGVEGRVEFQYDEPGRSLRGGCGLLRARMTYEG